MRTGIRFALVAVLALIPALPAAAVWTVQTLGRAEGLPSGQVHALAQGTDGAMFFAGPSGLVRYDGARAEVFGSDHGLATHGLRALALGPDGTLWIGSDTGIDAWRPDGALDSPLPPDTWSHGFVEDLAASADGSLWIASARGLLRWHPDDGLSPAGDGLPTTLVTAVELDAAGTLWAAGPAFGLWHRDGERWRRVDDAAPTSLAAAADGGVLAGGERDLLEVTSQGRTRTLLPMPGTVSAVLSLGAELWVAAGGQLRVYGRQDGRLTLERIVLEAARVNQLMADAQDNVWVATDSDGVKKISVLRRAISGLETPCVTSVFALKPTAGGGFLVGGDQCSWRLDAGLRTVERFAGLDRIKVWDFAESRDGVIWAATEEGLMRGTAGSWRPLATPSTVLAAPARVLLERDEAIWVGTVAGLARVTASGVEDVADPAGRSLGYVYTLEEDLRGRIWIGTLGRGLWRVNGHGGRENGGRENGDGVVEPVAIDHLRARGNVYAIAFSPAGAAAIVADDRVMLVDDGRARVLENPTGDAVAAWSAFFDAEDRLWVGGNSGLVRYDQAGRAALRLTATMGLGSDEFTTSRSLSPTDDGRLLCGLATGVSVVDPAALEQIDARPAVRLRALAWDNARVFAEATETVVEHGKWTVDAALYSPWFIDERSLLFRHRLRGFDEHWSLPAPAEELAIHYTSLPAGSYVLEAQAFTPLVGWGEPRDLAALRVLAPWWSRPATAPAWLALAGLLIAAAWHWRNQALVRRARRLESKVRQRTRELRLANRELERLATHDNLTGLPNQRLFWERAAEMRARSKRRHKPFALVVLDLDDFKAVNDTHGHAVGDEVLAHTARVLRDAVREVDFVARYGGEEFVVLLAPGEARGFAEAAERMRRALESRPCETGGRSIRVTGSFGVALGRGPDEELEDLFRRADEAVYRAKETKNRVVVCQADHELESALS